MSSTQEQRCWGSLGSLTNSETCESLVEKQLETAKRFLHLGPFISLDTEKTLQDARTIDLQKSSLPLKGLPIAVKDNIDVVGYPTTAGTPGLANWRPSKNASIIDLLINAGAVVFGKTNMHELAFGITSTNINYGAVKNPHNCNMVAGGSSGGSAVAVACGIVPVSLGTDTGGSVRIPAAFCGCVGFRPTLNRYPSDGIVPISYTRDAVGIMASDVADVICVDNVIAKDDKNDKIFTTLKDVRIGIPRKYFYEDMHVEIAEVIERALDKLKEIGTTLVEADLNVAELTQQLSFSVVGYECIRDLAYYLTINKTNISVRDILDASKDPSIVSLYNISPSNETYRNALKMRDQLCNVFQTYFEQNKVDVIAYPTTIMSAFPIGTETVKINNIDVPVFPAVIHNTDPASNAGVPCVSIPVGKTNSGLPVGLELTGAPGSDKTLLSIASLIFLSIAQNK